MFYFMMETVVRGALQDSRNKVASTKVAVNLQAQDKNISGVASLPHPQELEENVPDSNAGVPNFFVPVPQNSTWRHSKSPLAFIVRNPKI